MPTDLTPDTRPFRVYARDPKSGLLIHDRLIYRGAHCAERAARTITRVLGVDAEARPLSPPAVRAC
jgi:hypothetical protein